PINASGMYNVSLNKARKLVTVEVSGFVRLDEVNNIISECEQVVSQFQTKEALILLNFNDAKPTSQDVIPTLERGLTDVCNRCKKGAGIPRSSFNNMKHLSATITLFDTVESALNYLLTNTSLEAPKGVRPIQLKKPH